MKKKVSEAIGWGGMILILIAYILLNFNIIVKENLLYLSFNIIGSVGIAYISLKKKALQPAVLNIIWALVALYGLFAVFL
ncbi:hypothetical protein JXB27_02195 [Candidatus Woesearchaeota archaeon]|nr:hypothetical protein [Candidatus Woesearchaeota archaeon]